MTDINMRGTPRVVIGPLGGLGTIIADWGSQILLIADKTMESRAIDIQNQLDMDGINTIVFVRDDLSSSTENLDEVLSLARGAHSDFIGTIGGEKVLSLGRLVAAVSRSNIHAADLMSGDTPNSSSLPIFEIPSSGKHTLLFRQEALLRDSRTCRTVLVPMANFPIWTVLFDASITAQMSIRFSALSMISVLFSGIEAFLSPRSDYFSDIQARSAIQNAVSLLRRVKLDAADPDYRIKEAETVVLAAFATGLTGLGPGNILSLAVAAVSGVSKATIATVLLPWVLESPLYSGSPKLTQLADIIAESTDDTVESPAQEIRFLLGPLELPGRLGELGAELSAVLPASSWAVDILGSGRPDLNEEVFNEILDLSS